MLIIINAILLFIMVLNINLEKLNVAKRNQYSSYYENLLEQKS